MDYLPNCKSLYACVCLSEREGENIQPVLPWIQGSLTSVNHVMLVLKRFLLTQCGKLENPLHVREMLVQYKREQQLFKNFLYEMTLKGPGWELEEPL